LWNLGYSDQALKRIQEALALAQDLSHPNSLAFALSFAAFLHAWRQEPQPALEYATELIAVSTEQRFAHWRAMGTIQRGSILVSQGQIKEGIVELRQGQAADEATGARLPRTGALLSLAVGYGRAGQIDDGLHALVEASAEIEKTGIRVAESALYLIKGSLLTALSTSD
jgi:tetratricopeptide (TPR) repeat protein